TKPRGWVFPNNGKLLKIAVPLRVSYKEFVSQIPGTNMSKGFCIDVFVAAVNLLPYAVPYQFIPYGNAHALEAFFSQGGVVSFSNDSRLAAAGLADLHLDAMSIFDGGKLLLDNIWKTDFVGLTGHIKFNSDRNLVNPAYDIINVIGTGFRTVGYWSNGSGLTALAPESIQVNQTRGNPVLHSVIWPGEIVTKPRGWVFPNNGKLLKIAV
nr:glutamate receptor 3.3 isoform X1 [Tanacetum cinerariifolium]